MELPGYDEQLTRLTQFIKPRIHHLDPEEEEEEEEEEYDDDDDDDEEKLASIDKSAIPLAELLIPIIKLSRLFFKKLAKDGLNKTPLKPFTDMNSYQLTRLGDSAGRMSCDLDAIVRCIKESDDYDEADTTLEVMQTINRIRYAFDSHLLLVILYIVPLLPDLLSSPNHLQNSLITWSDLILVATQNLERVQFPTARDFKHSVTRHRVCAQQLGQSLGV
ncbi:hypothetical protein PCASD_04596 [Puccinia coronata f. sp. avenae]|uniref:Uncharacterized protein n=1 Tax=Puccinia coronata f. sp. avenae TaxID=200324 RepID=A0A2N5V539_9BASI|nr:hypothetical protein PCASD_04596 [Puccinia coronata f. sp. avenae]